jgi:ABC-type nitrate/sulfonate/bicarbonate transport system permease component
MVDRAPSTQEKAQWARSAPLPDGAGTGETSRAESSNLGLLGKAGWVFRTGGRSLLWTALPIILAFVVWQLIVSILNYPPAILPGPLAVVSAIGEEMKDGILWTDLISSFRRMMIGLLIGIPTGTILGLSMGVNHYVEKLLSPLLNFGLATPGIALVPFAILWFGLRDTTIVCIVVVEVVLVVMLSSWTGVRGVEPALLNAARTMGVVRFALFRRVLLPGSLLSIISGYRFAFSRAWRVLVGGEMLVGVASGLGYRISESQNAFRADRVYAGIIVIGIIGVLLERVLLRSLEVVTVDRWKGNA